MWAKLNNSNNSSLVIDSVPYRPGPGGDGGKRPVMARVMSHDT